MGVGSESLCFFIGKNIMDFFGSGTFRQAQAQERISNEQIEYMTNRDLQELAFNTETLLPQRSREFLAQVDIRREEFAQQTAAKNADRRLSAQVIHQRLDLERRREMQKDLVVRAALDPDFDLRSNLISASEVVSEERTPTQFELLGDTAGTLADGEVVSKALAATDRLRDEIAASFVVKSSPGFFGRGNADPSTTLIALGTGANEKTLERINLVRGRAHGPQKSNTSESTQTFYSENGLTFGNESQDIARRLLKLRARQVFGSVEIPSTDVRHSVTTIKDATDRQITASALEEALFGIT